MKHSMRTLHRTAAIAAFLMILTFFTSTLVVELFGDHHAILRVKTYILYAFFLLIPMMAIAGITGTRMAPKARTGRIGYKKKRMPFIAMNGLLILVPAAIYLHHLASLGHFNGVFYTVQAIELLAGLANLTLMGLNI